jgi:hypothetical protein
MLGAVTRADFEHCDVALFGGKNPWQSHYGSWGSDSVGVGGAPPRCGHRKPERAA